MSKRSAPVDISETDLSAASNKKREIKPKTNGSASVTTLHKDEQAQEDDEASDDYNDEEDYSAESIRRSEQPVTSDMYLETVSI